MRLFRQHPHRLDIPVLLVLSAGLFVFGVFAPVITFEQMVFSHSTFSILTSILSFFRLGNLLIGTVIVLFSIVFPAVKFLVLGYIWFGKLEEQHARRYLTLLKALGRWSMLDVFVILITVGSLQLGILGTASVRSGIYYFGAAIVGSIILSLLLANTLPAPEHDPSTHLPNVRAKWSPLLCALVGVLFFGVGMFLPLVTIDKWLFWESEYSLVTGSIELISRSQYVLGGSLMLFVILFPLLHFLSVLLLYLCFYIDWTEKRLLHVLLFFDDWSMIDVFGLALVVYLFKMSGDVHISPHPGFWCLMVAACLSALLSVQMALITTPENT